MAYALQTRWIKPCWSSGAPCRRQSLHLNPVSASLSPALSQDLVHATSRCCSHASHPGRIASQLDLPILILPLFPFVTSEQLLLVLKVASMRQYLGAVPPALCHVSMFCHLIAHFQGVFLASTVFLGACSSPDLHSLTFPLSTLVQSPPSNLVSFPSSPQVGPCTFPLVHLGC